MSPSGLGIDNCWIAHKKKLIRVDVEGTIGIPCLENSVLHLSLVFRIKFKAHIFANSDYYVFKTKHAIAITTHSQDT